jgi:hypothetical protein
MTSLEVSTLWFTFLVVLYRLSFGCVHTPLITIVLKTLPNDRLSMGSGVDRVHRGLESAFGTALGSTILKYRTLVHLIGLGERHEVSTLGVRETAADVAQLLMRTGELGERWEGRPWPSSATICYNEPSQPPTKILLCSSVWSHHWRYSPHCYRGCRGKVLQCKSNR